MKKAPVVTFKTSHYNYERVYDAAIRFKHALSNLVQIGINVMNRNLGATTDLESLLTEVKTVIIRAVNLHHIKLESIKDTTTLGPEGLNLDSIDILEVVLAIERHFGVKVENTEAGRRHFSDIGSIAAFVAQQKAGV